jgi:peptide/nickel transport system ATP-binding protein
MPLLEVSTSPSICRPTAGRPSAVRDVSFTLERGGHAGPDRRIGLRQIADRTGADGPAARHASSGGSIRLHGQELLGLSEAGCAAARQPHGHGFQEPMTALNPVRTIGRQVAEPLRRTWAWCTQRPGRGPALLERVGIRAPRTAPGRLPAPVLRRPAPAHHDCHGPGLPARPADCRRAHHRAGRRCSSRSWI